MLYQSPADFCAKLFERTAFILAKNHDGWRLHSEEDLGYE